MAKAPLFPGFHSSADIESSPHAEVLGGVHYIAKISLGIEAPDLRV
jgi:hypothetical protein